MMKITKNSNNYSRGVNSEKISSPTDQNQQSSSRVSVYEKYQNFSQEVPVKLRSIEKPGSKPNVNLKLPNLKNQ